MLHENVKNCYFTLLWKPPEEEERWSEHTFKQCKVTDSLPGQGHNFNGISPKMSHSMLVFGVEGGRKAGSEKSQHQSGMGGTGGL